MKERFAPTDKRGQNERKKKGSEATPLPPKAEEERQAEERDDFDLTTQGEKNSAPNRTTTRTRPCRQDQEEHHDGIGVAVKARHHERNRADREEKECPGRNAKDRLSLSEREQGTHDYEVRDDPGEAK